MDTPLKPYLLLFRDAGAEQYKSLSLDQRQALLAEWNAWYDRLATAGLLNHGHPLEPEGRIVTARGERDIDGPFAETKEAVGGYFYLTVASLDEATAIARQCPGLRFGITVEVRPVAEVCPVLRSSPEARLDALSRN
ncbi:hypothetical protein DB347_21190 [Opitutaceae bacterium EW11]|nr:hypothetical protein DB347_21190 [Opitutaceae bacterium EW11]